MIVEMESGEALGEEGGGNERKREGPWRKKGNRVEEGEGEGDGNKREEEKKERWREMKEFNAHIGGRLGSATGDGL